MELRVRGWRPVVLSRGYGAREDEVPDELALLAESLPGFRAVRDPDRVRGALTAIEVHCADALVLDDGFQHHRLARQLDLVAVDATAPFGGGHCLPRGTLREPVRALRRADVVVVTRSDQVPREFLDRVLRRVRRAAPRAAVATAVHRPEVLQDVPGSAERPLAWLRGHRVFAVSGIGNPAAFERTLADLGAVVVGGERYTDHHHYGPGDLAGISRRAAAAAAEAVVTTHKDAVKWKTWPSPGPPALCLTVRIAFTSGEEEVRARLRHALP
jgi:tetraacyldisaccharide 4'-kinase